MPPTRLIFVPARVLDEYDRELKAIANRYPHFDAPPPEGLTLHEHWANLATMRQVAIDELRIAIVRAAREANALGLLSIFPIAV